MTKLDVRHLARSFGARPILTDVTFQAPSGDILSVIGPSGCGKTTLFRCILGELDVEAGQVLLDGEDITRASVQERDVGIVYQNYALFPHLSVAENAAYGLRARRVEKRALAERVHEVLDLVRLTGKEDRHPHQLSGGERQRVALARALAVEPRVLLLDEAFAALDATTRGEVVHEVRRIIREVGLTTLLITHDQEEAFLFSRHVLVLNDGRVVTQGTPEEIMTHDDPFIQDFVKMVHLSRSKVELDAHGRPVVHIDGGQVVPLHLPGVEAGDQVHVMIKKGPKASSIEVWRDAER